MQTLPEHYREIRGLPDTYDDIRVVIPPGTIMFGLDKLYTVKIRQNLFRDKGPAVGYASSAEIDLTLEATLTEWPRNAVFRVEYRKVNTEADISTEWLPLGTFYTDTRAPDSDGTLLSVHAYDQIALLDVPWSDKIPEEELPDSWPVTAKNAVELMSRAVLFSVDTRSDLDNTVPFIGLDTTATVKDVLMSVAAGLGGNWCVTPENKLRLIPLKIDEPVIPAIAGIAIAGISAVGTSAAQSGVENENDDIFIVGRGYKKGKLYEKLPAVTAVELTSYSGDVASAESGEEGYTVKAECDFSSSAAAELCLSRLTGFRYSPFELENAWIDPSAELGDLVLANGSFFPIYSITWNVCPHICAAKIAAPHESVVDHECLRQSVSSRNYKKTQAAAQMLRDDLESGMENLSRELNSAIQQTASGIRTEVSENYYDRDGVDVMVSGVRSEITQTAEGLSASIVNVSTTANGSINEIKRYISYVEGVVTLGETENPSVLKVSSNEVGLYYNGVKTTYWNQNEQVTPNKVRIPEGGSLQEGSFIWQPRSSGNLSLMWVGE